MERNNVVISGWMTRKLKLSGNELLVFALIYGFSQDGDSEFYGSRRYIAEMFNISLPTVDGALKSLINKGLIIKDHINRNNISFNTYKVSLLPIKNEGVENFIGNKETLYNNNINNNNNNIINLSNDTNVSLEKNSNRMSRYDLCLSLIYEFTDDFELQQILILYLKMRLEIKDKPIYKNSWKGLLNKLNKLSSNVSEQIDIVQQSLDKGYASFYELPKLTNDKKCWNLDVRSQSYSQEELDTLEEEEKKLNARGIKTRF